MGFKPPAEVRASLPAGKSVVAFQNRNPVHKAHFELLVHAQKDVEDSIIFVHPTCGPTQPGDMDGTKSTLTSDDFYGPYEAQEMGKKHSAELDVKVVDYPNMVYVGAEQGNDRGYISDKA